MNSQNCGVKTLISKTHIWSIEMCSYVLNMIKSKRVKFFRWEFDHLIIILICKHVCLVVCKYDSLLPDLRNSFIVINLKLIVVPAFTLHLDQIITFASLILILNFRTFVDTIGIIFNLDHCFIWVFEVQKKLHLLLVFSFVVFVISSIWHSDNNDVILLRYISLDMKEIYKNQISHLLWGVGSKFERDSDSLWAIFTETHRNQSEKNQN